MLGLDLKNICHQQLRRKELTLLHLQTMDSRLSKNKQIIKSSVKHALDILKEHGKRKQKSIAQLHLQHISTVISKINKVMYQHSLG